MNLFEPGFDCDYEYDCGKEGYLIVFDHSAADCGFRSFIKMKLE